MDALAGSRPFLASSVAFGIVAKNDFDTLRATGCAPNCASSQESPIETKAVLSDVFLGLGIAAVATGVTLFVVRPFGAHTHRGSATPFAWPISF